MPLPHLASEPMSDREQYQIVRSQIEFEASLIAQRLSWFVASQSFLFTAYAIALNAPRDAAFPEYGQQQRLVYHLIPWVAIASCILIYVTILAAWVAQIHLRRFLSARLSIEKLALFPPVQGSFRMHLLGLAAPLGLPLVFASVWIFLFFHAFA